eukprot:COSAG06_NODE_151_length_21964_cov_95.963961_15_plen_184_part_00
MKMRCGILERKASLTTHPSFCYSRQAKMEKATEVAMRAERIAEQIGKLDDAATSGLARECTGNERKAPDPSRSHSRWSWIKLRSAHQSLTLSVHATTGEAFEKVLQTSEALPVVGIVAGLMNGACLVSACSLHLYPNSPHQYCLEACSLKGCLRTYQKQGSIRLPKAPSTIRRLASNSGLAIH